MSVCGVGALDFLTSADRDPELVPCCIGAAVYGPDSCTCWRPVFDMRQRRPRADVEPVTRSKSCHDCAFRRGSPERERGDELESLPSSFWCHDGIRRPRAWRHPDGRVRMVDLGTSPDYQPPIVGDVPYRANGRPADRCAGWAAFHR